MAGSNSCAVPKVAPCTLDPEISDLDKKLEQARLKFQDISKLRWKQDLSLNALVVPRMGTPLCINRVRGRDGLRVSDEEECATKVLIGDGTSNPQHSFDGMESENHATDTSTSAYNTG